MRQLKFRNTPTDPFSKASADPSSFGNLAISRGWVTQKDLEQALEVQRAKIPKLGQIMIEIGLLSEEQRDEILIEQRQARGQKIPTEELLVFERRKMRRRLEGLKNGFREATKHAKTFAEEVTGLTGEPLDSAD